MFTGIPRFDKFIEKHGECWCWRGGCNHGGYGKYWWRGRTITAHKFSYELTNGTVPTGLTLDHLCRVRNCVNPDHLEAVSIQVNLGRALNRPEKRTHCPTGHAYNEVNTYHIRGERRCKTCIKDRAALRRLRIREELSLCPA